MADPIDSIDGSLSGCAVAVTRSEPGELGRMIESEGGSVVHVPLIETSEPADGGAALRAALGVLDDVDWLIVTSPTGAARVGEAASRSNVRLAAVGVSTATTLSNLAGRPVELVPSRQLSSQLAIEFVTRNPSPQRVLLAVADRASPELGDELSQAGHAVTTITAYRTVTRGPTDEQIAQLSGVDALVFASGSAAEGWALAFGDRAASLTPDIVIAIGPSTERIARDHGLKITATAADHSVAGIVGELGRRWRQRV